MAPLRIGLVTSSAAKLREYFPTRAEPDLIPTEPPFAPDDQLLVEELRRCGHIVRPVVWGEESARLRAEFDRLVIRSPWDYIDADEHRVRFLRWIDALDGAAIPVDNPPSVMTWLLDKRYLLDLAAVGAPIVPTLYAALGQPPTLADCFQGGPLVVKPAVSAAGMGLVSLGSRDEVRHFQEEWTRLCQRQDYLIQPLIPEIRTAGEWSLVYLGGVYSHAVHKMPAQGQILCHAERGGSLRFAEAPAAVRVVGDQVIALLKPAFAQRYAEAAKRTDFPLLYLRLDVIESGSGPMVSECEGVEPELFFRARPGSERRFVQLLEAKACGAGFQPASIEAGWKPAPQA